MYCALLGNGDTGAHSASEVIGVARIGRRESIRRRAGLLLDGRIVLSEVRLQLYLRVVNTRDGGASTWE